MNKQTKLEDGKSVPKPPIDDIIVTALAVFIPLILLGTLGIHIVCWVLNNFPYNSGPIESIYFWIFWPIIALIASWIAADILVSSGRNSGN